MRITRRIAAATALAGVLALSGLSAAPAAGASEDTPTAGLKYVALGDSFTAGFGVAPYSEQPALGCYQSEQNYPHLVAEQLGLELTDASCSGAVTANIIDTPQPTITGEGTAPVQSDSLTADTDIVTVTIGGNDLGFSTIAYNCAAATASGPTYSGYWTCKQFYDLPENDLAERLRSIVVPALAKTYALINEKAPDAKVFVIGYPAITPDAANTPTDGCFRSLWYSNSFPFTATDTAMIHAMEMELESAIRAQAEAAGATFVPALEQSLAHSACAPVDEEYVAGITLSSGVTAEQVRARGLQVSDIEVGALHPNAQGVAYLDEVVSQAVAAAFVGVGVGSAPPAGAVPTSGIAAQDAVWAAVIVGALVIVLAAVTTVVIVVRRRRRAVRVNEGQSS